MATTSIEDRSLQTLLDWAIARTEDRDELQDLYATLQQARQRLNEPMRVAIVGLIKAGKSTVLNALLGKDIAATGTVETTFNVNWLRFGQDEHCEVVFKDNRPRLRLKLDELAGVTARLGSRQDVLHDVAHIEVFLNLDILKRIELIDTPGLSSVYEDDEQNTRDFLSLHGEEISDATKRYSSGADAIIYLFSKGLHEEDQEVMKGFAAVGNATPINAIGALTKVDNYFDPREHLDPLEQGRQIANRLRSQDFLRRVLYNVVPVSGIQAAGGAAMTEADWKCIVAMASFDEKETSRLLRSAQRIVDRTTFLGVDPNERASVLRQIGLYGLTVAIEYARTENADLNGLRERLLKGSGVRDLLQLVHKHFGGRATTIKAKGAFDQVSRCWTGLKPRASAETTKIGDNVLSEIEAFTVQELDHSLTEIDLLRMIYDARLDLSDDEAEEARYALGEYGRSCAARLGCKETTDLEELSRLAKERAAQWRKNSQSMFMLDRDYLELCTAMTRTFERAHARIQSAQRVMTF